MKVYNSHKSCRKTGNMTYECDHLMFSFYVASVVEFFLSEPSYIQAEP